MVARQLHEGTDRQPVPALLQEAAQRLNGMVRTSDVVARLGGDEFVVLVQGTGNQEQSARDWKRLNIERFVAVVLALTFGGTIYNLYLVHEGQVAGITTELLGLARRSVDGGLGGKVSAALLGSGVAGNASDLGEWGADTVYVADDTSLAPYRADAWLAVLQQVVQQANPTLVLFGQTSIVPAFRFFSSKYGEPHSGHVSGTGFQLDVKSHLG